MLGTISFEYKNVLQHEPNLIEIDLNSALDYLNSIKDGEKILNDQLSYEAIFLIGRYIAFKTERIIYKIFMDKNLLELFSNILAYLYEIIDQYDFSKDQIAFSSPTPETSFNERCTSIFFYIEYIINLISNKSIDFLKEIPKTDIIKTHLKFIDNDEFVDKNEKVGTSVFTSVYLGLLDYLAINMSRFSVVGQYYKELYTGLNAIKILLKFKQ